MSSGDRLPPQYLDERAIAEALRQLPIFPLPDVVMFPHALLPLHVFEPRYRKLTQDALASNRLMGLALLIEDEVAGESPPRFAPILGVGEIVMAQELPDGRFNLVVRGRARIEIAQELTTDEPYRVIVGKVRADLPVKSHAELADADQALRALVGRLAENIPEGGELLRQVVASQATPEELADVLAAALVVDVPKRQRLLETRDLVKRIERVTAEVVAMTARIAPVGPSN